MISEKDAVKSITEFILNKNRLLAEGKIPVAASSRHIHISRGDLEKLFGRGYCLKPFKMLSQPQQYAAEEKVTVKGPKGTISNVRILGPERKETQLEISMTDAFTLGVNPPVRDSGNLEGSPGITLQGPAGEITISQGVILSLRHVHMTTEDAKLFGLKDKDQVGVRILGTRGLTFDNVLVRVSDKYFLEMHIDTDEANAAGLGGNASGMIIKK